MCVYSCGDDEPDAGITRLQSHLDERFDNIKSEIDTLKEDVELLAAGAKTPLSDGVIPPDTRKDPDVIKDETGGLPPTGVPTGEPVLDPIQGIPVFGEGQIVFCLFSETDAHGNYNIFAINVDGTNRIRLTNNPADDERPDWSPDGRQIAIADNGEGEIYVINADGTGLTNITNSPDYETSPDWQ